jgi:hypothetical protein
VHHPYGAPSTEVIKTAPVAGGGATGARLDFGMTPDRDLATLLIDPDGVCSILTIEHLELAGPTLPTRPCVTGAVMSKRGAQLYEREGPSKPVVRCQLQTTAVVKSDGGGRKTAQAASGM